MSATEREHVMPPRPLMPWTDGPVCRHVYELRLGAQRGR